MPDAAPLARQRRLMVLITLLLVAVGLALAVERFPDASAQPQDPPPHEAVASVDGALVLTPVVRAPSMLTGLVSDGVGGTYLVGKQGVIWHLDVDAGEVTPWLDLTDRVDAGGYEQGLLGLAFADEGRFYVNYTRAGGDTHVSRFATPDPAAEEVLLTIEQPWGNHNGGDLHFAPDGMLWIAVGDGGSANDPAERAQNPHELLGSMLRIDVSADSGYAIPADNPWADGEGGRPEIATIGARNPWRFSFDAATNTAWIGDVGQGAWEEINAVGIDQLLGANLGWDVYEGEVCVRDELCDMPGLTAPTYVYSHDEGCSVTGGVVARDGAPAALRGAYLFSDFCSGWIRALRRDGGDVRVETVFDAGIPVASFGVDDAGAIWVVALDGRVWRIDEA